MVKTIQTWLQTAPMLYTVRNILKTLVQEDVGEEGNARKGGEQLDHDVLDGGLTWLQSVPRACVSINMS